MPFKRSCVVAFLLASPCVSLAQTGRITGTTLMANGSEVGGVQVTLVGTSRSAVSVNSGAFTIDDVPPGSYSARAVRQGLEPSVQTVVVTPGQTSVIIFVLNSTPLTPALISFGEPANPLPPQSLKLPVPVAFILRSKQSEGSLPFNPRRGQRVLVELFERPGLIVEIEQTSPTSDGVEATGSIISGTGVRSGLVTIVVRQGRVIANIRHGLRLYMIRPQSQGIHLIIEVDAGKLPGDDGFMTAGPGAS